MTAPDNVQRILAYLEGVVVTGNGWSARCPAHDDRVSSLSIALGNNGQPVLRCHAGCSFGDVVRVLSDRGYSMRHSGGNRRSQRHDAPRTECRPQAMARVGKPSVSTDNGVGRKPKATFPSVAAAVAFLKRTSQLKSGARTGTWTYQHGDGSVAFLVLRFDFPDGRKTYRPVHPWHGGYALGDPPGCLPLYHLPELEHASEVCVCEGEKAADALRSIGFIATTSAHGAAAPSKTDWMPLRGKCIAIFPDNDDSGRAYARKVAASLGALGCAVKIVPLSGLPEHGDVVDYLAEKSK